MQSVSQRLIEFANRARLPAAPGVEIIDTPRYRISLQPDFPIAGPNAAGWIRCAPEDADAVIDEVRVVFRQRGLPMMWRIDPETEPADFAERLAARGAYPAPHASESAVMVLPVEGEIVVPVVPGLVIHDALADFELFRQADLVAAEAFDNPAPSDLAALARRWRNHLAAGNHRQLLATVDGEPAGSARLTLHPPDGGLINGGAVLARFRGRGVYRALVAARLDLARQAGVDGLVVWAGDMSRPILERLGFVKVGWRRFYLDPAVAVDER